MSNYTQYVTYAQWGLVAFAALFAVLGAVRGSKAHVVKPALLIVSAVVPFLGAFVVMSLGGFGVSPVYAIVAIVIGAGIGFLLGRSVKYGTSDGKLIVKPSPVAPWLTAVTWILLLVAIMFVTANAASAAMLLLLLALAMGLTETILHVVRAPSPTQQVRE